MKTRYIIYLVVCLFVLSACNGDQQADKEVAPFSFTDQNNQSFGTEDLTGTVWIASFIFTGCETVCPPMMFELASLQSEFEELEIDVNLVSFTVDPEIDSPKVLKQYIEQFTDNETNWHMLTGYSLEEIEDFAREQFQTIVQKPSTSDQVLHGTNFYLVDDQGYILKEYNYIDESYAKEITKDIKEIY